MSREQQLVEENRILREELEALKRERTSPSVTHSPHPPAATPPSHRSMDHAVEGHAAYASPSPNTRPGSPPTHRFHEDDRLKGSDFMTQRTKAAKDAINDDVTHEFFSAHEKNTALNVQRDIRQSCRIAEDRMVKLDDALSILQSSQEMVKGSAEASSESIQHNFEKYRVELRQREQSFMTDLDNHKDGELRKIRKEKDIVVQLLNTLENLVTEASNLMSGPDPDFETDGQQYKTLAEIKDEFTSLRQVMLPWDMGYLFDMISAKASEQMIDLRTTAVHDIIARLIEMLSSAREKASVTLDTLNNFISDVEKVVPEAKQRIAEEFRLFDKIVGSKEEMFASKATHYSRNYTDRIEVERECIEEWFSILSARSRSSKEAIDLGNDHRLLKELENLNQTLVQVDGCTLTLGYDNMSFQPVPSVLSSSLDQLGTLQREEMPCKALISPIYHYYQFLEHKEFMYGGSETQAPLSANAGITKKERALFERSFKKIDKYKDGTLSEEELEVLWAMVFTAVPRQAISCITARIFEEINVQKKERIHFDEFLSYVSEGMHTNLGAQRDQFYRAAVQSGVESEIASTTTAPLVQAADAQNKSDESGQEAPDQASEGGGNSA